MKYVYSFTEGSKDMANILGGKGANLAEMTNLGLPIPEGFTITTEACNDYYNNDGIIKKEIEEEIITHLKELESITNQKFGDKENPLLLSIRSGARASMPGMMDTILNLGLNDISVEGFASYTNNPRFAYDSYRRFIQMYANVVKGLDNSYFEKEITKLKDKKGIISDGELELEDLKELVLTFKNIYKEYTNEYFPEDVKVQLMTAIASVFKSWQNKRAISYRKMNDIPDSWGTAVNVQRMVFGNMGETSGTGVAFTRNPATGEKGIYGEYLINAQGEDVVAGIRTPDAIWKLEKDMPECFKEFIKYATLLEKHYKDMQDMEFTIEKGKLYFLQTRNGKRTAAAAIKIACDLIDEGMITEEEALMRIDAKSLEQLLHPVFVKEYLDKEESIATGVAASPGAAAGKVVFNSEDAKTYANMKERVILVRGETTPEDIEGMAVCEGVLTSLGGRTSHAAVVARGMGTCCITGCNELKIDEKNKICTLGNYTFKEGDYISLDGNTGKIYKGDIKREEAKISGDFKRIMTMASKYHTLGVYANADNKRDTLKAIELGCDGIGLCRSEHMFFEDKRILKMREMILASTKEERNKALDELLLFQKSDYKEMLKILKGMPLTVRYLDPPLHEFLPNTKEEMLKLSEDLGISIKEVEVKCTKLREVNPMMGHRGCRLEVTYPEIAVMQTRALLEAAIEVNKEDGYDINLEIMIPLISDKKELKFIKDIVIETAEKVKQEKNSDIKYSIGTMIEIPRAALLADEIAEYAEFFSFGTNDLTQMTYGLSRDDAAKFLDTYYQNNIYEIDPFAKLDKNGVGKLIEIAVKLGKKTRKDIKLGICGEHGGDPESIAFFNKVGLTYVSCSPYRVPTSILAVAQAAIKEKNNLN